MFAPDQPVALFDDNLSGNDSLMLHGLVDTVCCTQVNQLNASFAAIEQASANGYWIALAASYELGEALEPKLRAGIRTGPFPLLNAWVFEHAEHWSDAKTEAALATAAEKLDEHQRTVGTLSLTAGIDKATYCDNVERIRELIAAGDCYQVNYTYALRGQLSGDPLAMYTALRQSQPVRYGTFIRHPEGTILSRSPELFVQRTNAQLTCKPMKGTASRERDALALAQSEKDRAENLMIVDLIRNDLGRLAPAGGVRVQSLFDLEAYPSLWQMTSTITAEPIHTGLLEIFRALYPCGSITGAPKIRAMQIIRELEPTARQLYCGALGWIAPGGDFRFSVPIRTLQADTKGHFQCGLGSGIVADSAPQDEWAECRLKSRFLTDIRPKFGLIETLRCEADTTNPYPLLQGHLHRLQQSARTFGFACNETAISDALRQLAAPLSGTHRVRLELHADGQFKLTHTPLAPLNEAQPSVCLAAGHVHSADPLLQHKITARSVYDQALAAAMQAGHFDALFLNELGQLTEGARSNIFLDMGDRTLLTPALECGVLNGVYRRKLIDDGGVREAIITADMLHQARALYASNALRGLIPVRLVEA